MIVQPLFNNSGMMNPQVVKNQKDLLICTFDESLYKLEKRLRVHGVSIDHESNFTLIGYRRNQINSLTLGRKSNGRRFPARRIASTMLAVITKTGFVTPLNFSIFCQ